MLHGQRYLAGQRLQAEHWLDARPGDLVWCTAASGWSKSARNAFIAPWLRGAAALLHDARFDPHERLELLERERVDVLCMAPTEYRVIAKRAEPRPLAGLRGLVAAGEALDPGVLGAWHEATGLWIRDGYGQTETGQLTGMPLGRAGAAGLDGPPAAGRRAARSWTASSCCDPATDPTFFLRYLGEAPQPAGPWRTGDRVRADDDGFLHFEGRTDDVIISAGYRIGPFEVESALGAHPAVAEAAVVAAPDDERGSVVRAVVVLRDGTRRRRRSPRELQDHVKARDGALQVPAHRRLRRTSCRARRAARSAARRCATDAPATGRVNRTPAPCSVGRMTDTLAETAIDPARVAALTERERARADRAHAPLGRVLRARRAVMPGGVPSQFQKSDPWPVYLERGEGARVWDVDGNEYLDFHNGFGVMCVGHANPVIAAAVKARMDDGTHFAAPTEGSIVVAEELRRRWGLPPGASRTPARSRRWTPSTSPAARPATTSSSRSRAPTTATTTP